MPIICNDNANGCYTGSYYPRPIFNCCQGGSCGGRNNVVNPTRSEEWGFLTGGDVQAAQNEHIPLTLTSSAGTAVSQSVADEVNITTGNYQVAYSVNASSSVNPLQFGLELNGTVLPYSIISGEGDGNLQNLATSFIISVPTNSQLSVVNLTAGAASMTRVNLSVTKLLS